MDEFKIDGQKISYHIRELSGWLKGEMVWPIYVEIAPSGGCNQRCVFCAFDYLGYKARFIDTDSLKGALRQMAKGGVKSVMFAGEGEPLLHKDIAEIVLCAKKSGLDAAMTTNGTLLSEAVAGRIIPHLDWLRISLDAASARTYARLHRCKEDVFRGVLENLRQAVRIKRKNNYSCSLGAQLLLLEENYRQARELAGILKDIGLDYLVLKPYSQHPKSKNRLGNRKNYADYQDIGDKLLKLSDNNFKVILRVKAVRKLEQARGYQNCLALPFWAYISSQGDVCACSSFLGDKRYIYGNIHKDSFRDICEGKRRKDIIAYFAQKFDAGDCRKNCRMDEVNRYLWELKHPGAHINFI